MEVKSAHQDGEWEVETSEETVIVGSYDEFEPLGAEGAEFSGCACYCSTCSY